MMIKTICAEAKKHGTNNKAVLNNSSTLNDAMGRRLDGGLHEPEKISFQHLEYSISDREQQVEHRKGQTYTGSPCTLRINDGSCRLLAFDDCVQDMRTCRVDRMNMRASPESREMAQKSLTQSP